MEQRDGDTEMGVRLGAGRPLAALRQVHIQSSVHFPFIPAQ